MTIDVFIAGKTLAALLVPGILVLLLFVVIFLVARGHSRPAPSIRPHRSSKDEWEDNPEATSGSDSLPAYSSSYEKPLFLILDAAQSGESALLRALKEAFLTHGGHERSGTSRDIARFKQGTVLEAGGRLVAMASNGNGATDVWKKDTWKKDSRKKDAWQQFVVHLERRRPHRPLDGVILAVPCADFVGEHGQSREQWQQRAGQIAKNLLLMRNRLGFSFPVYVLITKCDVIRGFQEFTGSQLLSHTREIFGWSNPFNLDAPFDPRWGQQAFAYMRKIIEEQRVYFLARSHNGGQALAPSLRDEVFLFPATFRAMEAPVSDFLANLFRSAGYRDGLQFRGLYFSGDSRPQNGNGDKTRHVHTVAANFIADLFAHKIFPERGLAHPVDTELPPRNREVYLAKALCWLAAIGLFSGTALAWRTLSTVRDNTLPHMARVSTAMGKKPAMVQAEQAYDAIYTAQALSGSNFQSFFLPSSLLSDLNSKLKDAMPPVFDRLVYPGLCWELARRANQLLNETQPCKTDQGVNPAPSAGQRPQTSPSPRLSNLIDVGPLPRNDSGPCEAGVLLASVQRGNTASIAGLRPAPTASQRLTSFMNGEPWPPENGLLSLEDNIALFNRLALDGPGRGSDIVRLAGNLAPCTFANVPQKTSATMDAIVAQSHGAPFDAAPWHTSAVSRIEALVTDVLRQRLDEDQLLATVTATMDQIDRLESKDLQTNEQLAGLSKSLGQVQSQLAAPGLDWLAKNEYQLPPDISQALNPLFTRVSNRNALLCDVDKEPEFCAGLIQLRLFIWPAAHTHCLDFRTKLLASRTNVTGDLIVGTDDKLQLSPGALGVQTALDGFLKLPFVEHMGAGQIQDVTPGEQLLWNSTKLQEALANKAAYDKFFGSDLANADSVLQEALEDVALDRLEASMTDSIAAAQEIQPLPSPDKAVASTLTEAQAFAAAAQPLTKLLDDLGELNFEDDYQDLSHVSSEHAFMVLKRIDGYFDSQNFYWPAARNFDSWIGDTPPTTAAYAKPSVDDMLAYLALQRQDWQPYVVAAKPLAAFLEQRGPRGPKPAALLAKWLGIANDVQKYDSAPPSSTLGSLENYLAIEMDKTVPPDCQAAAAAPAVPVYFAQTQRSLARAVSDRCRLLARGSGNTQYSQLASFFNDHLAGKFPFCTQPPPGTQETGGKPPFCSPSVGSVEADPNDVVELFRLLDAENKALHQAVEGHASAQLAFVNQLEALRPIFASLFSPQPDQAPAWDLAPVFRVNRGHEINGNQIIDWTFAAGNTAFRNSEAPKIGHWSFGQPVTLTLRWAKDSPNRPIADAPANNFPDTKTVVFDYRDKWALLRMLVEHAASSTDFDHKVDPDPQTLAFTIGQQVVPEPAPKARLALLPGNQTAAADVKVFVGIRLYAPGKTTSLLLPAFPVRAPAP